MRKKGYEIKLKPKERQHLTDIVKKGSEKARKITRCRLLLLSEQEATQQRIAEMLDVTYHTVRNVCHQYIEEGLEAAINEKPTPGRPNVFEGKQKAKITALACSKSRAP
jgi:putative transposase